MTISIVNVKVDSRIKTQAKRAAEQLGLSLSGVINVYLRELVRTETLYASTRDETPTPALIASLRHAKRNHKLGKNYTFDNPKDAQNFLDTLSTKRP